MYPKTNYQETTMEQKSYVLDQRLELAQIKHVLS